MVCFPSAVAGRSGGLATPSWRWGPGAACPGFYRYNPTTVIEHKHLSQQGNQNLPARLRCSHPGALKRRLICSSSARLVRDPASVPIGPLDRAINGPLGVPAQLEPGRNSSDGEDLYIDGILIRP